MREECVSAVLVQLGSPWAILHGRKGKSGAWGR
jgi:hypothetical protein